MTVEAEIEHPIKEVLAIDGTQLSAGEEGHPEKSCILVMAVKAVIESESDKSGMTPSLKPVMVAVMFAMAVSISADWLDVLNELVFLIESLNPLIVVPMEAPPTADIISPVPPTKHDEMIV